MKTFSILAAFGALAIDAPAQTSTPAAPGANPGGRFREAPFSSNVKLADVRMRDACVLADPTTQTYTIIASAFRGVRAYTSKDLRTWEGPHMIFRTPENFWPGVDLRGIWAPELHHYRGKYYLFLTFDSATQFPEQWRNWLPRVHRGSQILVADAPLGPYKAFRDGPTLPDDMMTLDGTLWEEDGVPYMVFCHEWVQIKDGTVEMIRLQDDLSGVVGEPQRLFNGSDAPWSLKSRQYGCHVTDGPFLYRTKGGKLLMLWSSGSNRSLPSLPCRTRSTPRSVSRSSRSRASASLILRPVTAMSPNNVEHVRPRKP